MMKAIPRFDKELEKWVIDIETEEGEIIYTYMKNNKMKQHYGKLQLGILKKM